jgi:hypothetical protein
VRHLAAVVLLLSIASCVLSGCGSKADNDGAGNGENAAVLNTIDNFYMAFTGARPGQACALMTQELRRSFTRMAVRAIPSLEGKDCGHVYMPFYRRVPPENAPRAITLAAGPEYPTVHISGDRATAAYKEGGEIELQRVHGRWLIDSAELAPTPTTGKPD